MIVTSRKKLSDILKFLVNEKSVFILGCSVCSETCKTGGEKEALEMKAALEKEGLKVAGSAAVDSPCIASKARIALAKNKKAIGAADSILTLACGLGAQSLKDNLFSDKTIHIGCDTQFMGIVDKDGALLERCSGCGDCILELTDMICPVVRCAKGLVNGPCGGQDKGKCEVDRINPSRLGREPQSLSPEGSTKDCAWILIYEALKKKNKLHLLKEIRPPRDHSKALRPRSIKV